MIENEKIRIEVSIETHEIKIIRIRGGAKKSAYCERCQAEMRFFSLVEIAGFLQITISEIERRIADGELHLIGNRKVCGTFAQPKTNFIKALLNENED